MTSAYKPPASLFKANDIRGIAMGDEAQLTPGFTSELGRALGTTLRRRGQSAVWVCRDGRLSSPGLHEALVTALLNSGIQVLDLGIGPTPLLCHAVATRPAPYQDCDSGVMITASHNPPDHNGFKILIQGKPFFGAELASLRELILSEDYLEGHGTHLPVDHQPAYLADFSRCTNLDSAATTTKIVLDAANGAAGPLALAAMESAGVAVVPLFCEIDGSFPNHSPDTSDPKNLADLARKVVAEKAFCGIALDGDGDRMVAVTHEGQILNADDMMRIFSEDVLENSPGSTIVCDVKSSNHLSNQIRECGGQPLMTKSGRSHIQSAMNEHGAMLAGEFSSHFFFADNWYGSDDGIYAAARLLEICQQSGKELVDMLASKKETHATNEIYLAVSDQRKFGLIRDFIAKAEFDGANLVTIDGLRIEYPAGWALVRASNTTAAITLRFEANTEDELDSLVFMVRTQLERIEPELDLEKLDVSRL